VIPARVVNIIAASIQIIAVLQIYLMALPVMSYGPLWIINDK